MQLTGRARDRAPQLIALTAWTWEANGFVGPQLIALIAWSTWGSPRTCRLAPDRLIA
jgi:hypothetical protein